MSKRLAIRQLPLEQDYRCWEIQGNYWDTKQAGACSHVAAQWRVHEAQGTDCSIVAHCRSLHGDESSMTAYH